MEWVSAQELALMARRAFRQLAATERGAIAVRHPCPPQTQRVSGRLSICFWANPKSISSVHYRCTACSSTRIFDLLVIGIPVGQLVG